MMDETIRRLERYCLHAPGDALVGDALSLILGLVAERAQLVQSLNHMRGQRDEAYAILKSIVTDEATDPCHYDHHGYCQAHALQPKGECYQERARSALGGG